MKCQKCGNNATTHFIQNINGETQELWLCSDCAEELGIGGMFSGFEGFGAFDPFNMFEEFGMFEKLLGGMFGAPTLNPAGHSAAKASHSGVKTPDRCPLCGSTFEDIVKRGKAGCPQCYEHFASQLAPSIERLHGTNSHTPGLPGAVSGEGRRGTVIPPAGSISSHSAELASLRAQLEKAVAAEEYEKAAELHKKIKKLEAE